MMPLGIIRPEPGCAASVSAARALGLDAHGFPLFEVVARDWTVPDAAGFDSLLVGSANAFRLGGKGLAALRGLPVHAVGKATADAARAAGFTVATVGEGGLQSVLDGMTGPARLLRLAGEERVELVPPAGIEISECVVYASEARAMPSALADMLRAGAVVLLHSGEAARHFAAECDRLALDRSKVHVAALAPRIAEAAGQGWATLAIAERAQDAALLALARHMCQNAAA